MKKVLVIAYDFPPMGGGGVMRISKFLKYLKLYKYEPIILTVDKPDYYPLDNELNDEVKDYKVYRIRDKYLSLTMLKNKVKKRNNIDEHQALNETKTDTKIVNFLKFLADLKYFIEQNLFIPDKNRFWIKEAAKKAEEIVNSEKIDLVFITSPPHSVQLIGLKLKERFPSLPLVIDLRDAWTFNPLYLTKNIFKTYIEKIQERKIFNAAQKIVLATNSIERHYTNQYNYIKDKFVTITNGFDSKKYKYLDRFYKKNNQFTIVYTGSIGGKGRKAKFFLEACHELMKENQFFKEVVLIKFIGNFLEDKVFWKNEFKNSIQFVDHVSQSIVIDETMNADLLLLTFLESQGGDTVLTGKLFEYIAARRPILALIPDGEAKSLILKENIGFCCEPENIKSIKQVLLNVFNMWINDQLYVDSAVDLSKFDRINLTKELCLEFDKVINK